MAFDGDRVTITYDAGIDRPLRLTPDEALALVVALRMLAETPGRRRAGRGRAGPRQDRARGRRPRRRAGRGPAAPATPTGSRSCAARSSAATRCGSPTTPRPGTRPPSGWSTRCGCSWSAAGPTWRRGAAGPRRSGCSGSTGSTPSTELDEPARRPSQAQPTDVSAGTSSAPRRTCRWSRCGSGRGARWITEYYPCEEVVRGPGGALAGVAARLRPGLGPAAGARARRRR